ncbi:MAG: Hpt domain-containing protein [Christensenellaceae bacterium]|jgi:HPt (histidine-containing phosphotransfer) domain-containing protein|nr:Hpt domain-containing protein [Christensenellaceae bacterium]
MEYINEKTGLQRAMGMKKLFIKFLNMFAGENSQKQFADLEAGVASAKTPEEWVNCGNIAHAIKGIAGNLSLDPLFEISQTIMVEMRTGEPLKSELWAQYQDVLANTRTAITNYLAANA